MQASRQRCRARWRLLAPAPVRPSRPRLSAAWVPSDWLPPAVGCAQRAPPAGLAAFSPSSLSSLSGAPRSAPPRRLSGSPPPASCRRYARRYAPKTLDPARAGATVGRCLPAVRACQVWGLWVQHWRRKLDDSPPFPPEFGFGQSFGFFQVPRRPCLKWSFGNIKNNYGTVNRISLRVGRPKYFFYQLRCPKYLFDQLTVAIFLLGHACTKSHAGYTSTCSTGRRSQCRSRRAIWLRTEGVRSCGVHVPS
jgi:hypothetical protein